MKPKIDVTFAFLVLFVILVWIFLFGCSASRVPAPIPIVPRDFTTSVTFNYDFTNFAACSSTLTTGCISGFTWGYLQGSNQVPLKTSTTAVCTGSTQPEACADSISSQLPMGSVTFYAVANFVNNAGAAGSSAAATTPTPIVITAGAVTNLGATVK